MNAPRAIALCQCFTGALEFQAGHWLTAESALRDAIKLYRDLGAASGEALSWQRLGLVQTARGELSAGMDSFNEGIIAAERATMRAHCLTRLYASMTRNRLLADDLAAANEYLEMGLTMGERHGHCSTCDALLLPVAVSVRLAQQEFAEAESFYQRLQAEAKAYGSCTWVAMADQAHGELAAEQGELDTALTSYTAACDLFQSAGYDYEAARCLEALAHIYRQRNAKGDAEQAEQMAQVAGEIFAKLTAV